MTKKVGTHSVKDIHIYGCGDINVDKFIDATKGNNTRVNQIKRKRETEK